MKRTLLVLIVTLLAGVLFAGTYSGGSGISGDEYQIYDLDDLQELQNTSADWSADFIQTANIDASATSGWDSGAGFDPIGDISINFTGSYDGQGYYIDALFINRPTTTYVGLFGFVQTNWPGIRNLGLSNVNITGRDMVGGMFGWVQYSNDIYNCNSQGSVHSAASGDVGGLVGYSYNCIIQRCFSTASVTAGTSGVEFGGLIGIFNGGQMYNCYARGNVSGLSRTGGLVGNNYNGRIEDCYSTGYVTGTTYVGGLIGYNNSGNTYTNFWDMETSGTGTGSGGGNPGGITGGNTAQMKTESNFTNAGWDFTTIWDMDGTTNDGYAFLLDNHPDPPLPVELSTFTAIYDNGASFLQWTTQSESNNMGWNIYRSETGLEDAAQINGHLITGAGTTTEPTDYVFSDETPTVIGTTYNYWLESRDYSGNSENFGPISLYIPSQNEENPDAPEIISNITNYPNPFSNSTTISFETTNSHEQLRIDIYNLKGQKVRTLECINCVDAEATQSLHSIIWDGTDQSSKEVSSGVYTYIIKAGSEVHTGKMILTR
ncbi:MAG: T9SS type A sorting domain-containing protein [Candidatus Cloacimonetes bacterium]|nr:T9SS type A sorting domain-containing protein [Candidatus Cloacimonadota bacterium]